MPISLTIQCSFILTTYKARTKPETWHHYLPPSTISKRTLSGVLGHIKYHLFPSNNIAFFCLCFYPSSQLMFSSRNCNILAVGQCAPLPRRTIHHKIRAVAMLHLTVSERSSLNQDTVLIFLLICVSRCLLSVHLGRGRGRHWAKKVLRWGGLVGGPVARGPASRGQEAATVGHHTRSLHPTPSQMSWHGSSSIWTRGERMLW